MFASLIAKNLLQRPLRYVLTGLAIAFGVAAVTAVFIFTDGLRTTFNDLGADIQSNFDIAIQSDSPFGDNLSVPPVPLELLDEVAAVDGVVSAQPRIIEFGIIPIDDEGQERLGNGPNIGINWESRTDTPRLFPQEGRAPAGPGEFAMDIDGADGGAFTVGNTYTVLTPSGSDEFELVGTFNFANEEANAAVGAVLLAFEETVALDLLNGGRGYDDIVLRIDDDPDTVLQRLEPILAAGGDTLKAVDQQELIEEQQSNFGQILGIFQTVLLVFAVIILIVSAFLIFNVFTITLGQRIRELGLLRSIGAYGAQVTNMMLGEAFALGVAATIVGLPAGWGLAWLLRWGLSQLGFPSETGLPVRSTTILYALLVGIVVTLLAALAPAIRARRVTPIAALRDGGGDDDLEVEPSPTRLIGFVILGIALIVLGFIAGSWISMLFLPLFGGILIYLGIRSAGSAGRNLARIGLLVIGLALLTIVRFGDFDLGPTFGLLGAGALLTIVGASLVSGLFAGPVARVLGYPVPLGVIVGIIGVAAAAGVVGLAILGIAEIVDGTPVLGVFSLIGVPIVAAMAWGLIRTARGAFGLTGQVARENAARNPSRTATTATALMIGLALVSGVTVIGDSIKRSVTNALDSSISADWLVQGPNQGPAGAPFATEVETLTAGLPEVERAIGYRFAFAAYVHVEGVDAATVRAEIPSLFAALGARDDAPAALEEVKTRLGARDLHFDDAFSADFGVVREHIDPDIIEIDPSIPDEVSVWLEREVAAERNLAVGDPFTAVFIDGQVEELVVGAIYDDGFVFGDQAFDDDVWARHLPTDTYTFLTATTAEGFSDDDARTAIEGALDAYPVLTVQDRDEFAAEAESQINQTLATVNVLLALSALIAILGIAIALSLAVFERTREIGLLRAVGTTRQQTRWIVRWEGVIVAAFGGLVGVVVGVGLGVLATQKMPEFLVNTLSVPVPQLILYVIIAALTGLGAGAFPAWVAGRMDVLDAISHE